MNVFISWSGKTSGELAKVLRDWLPSVIQAVKPYFSTDDIEKGTRGNTMLAQELEEASIGILCLTRENLEAPWIMFEAGALSKSLDKSRVCPILFGDIVITDLQGPLTNFQAAKFNKDDMLGVLETINKQSGELSLETKVLDKVFEKWWPELEQEVKEVLSRAPQDAEEQIRGDRDLLEEILMLARQIPSQGMANYISQLTNIMRPKHGIIQDIARCALDAMDAAKVLDLLTKGFKIDPVLANQILEEAHRRYQIDLRKRLFERKRPKETSIEEIKSEVKKLRKTGVVKK